MRIEIEARSGFCFGVKRAIERAEEALHQGEPLFCLGQIVHNEEEEKRLQGLGMQQLEPGHLKAIQGKRVLLRAHGEPPETYHRFYEKGARVIDATCPVVIKLQKRVKKAFEEMPGAQILIYGKQGHPEVIGLEGQTGYRAIVVGDNAKDLEIVDLRKPVVLFSQTTKSLEGFGELIQRIWQGMQSVGADPDELLTVNDTICRQVSRRGPAIKKFAQSHDVIIFVSGINSSNGRYLFGLCREVNPKTYLVGHAKDLQKEWIEGAQSVGISGATSTPRWQLEQVAEAIKNLT
ncbi:MAG: 4-hydroxy-3-methylbut-2-enyl diphosphate reductase [Bacteroides sp.]|jgi:4-hydroxy-3-methylbut-2-enyl diphosphate reductase|nr:4-hydroxy-3-methylbut-2-enyl diphosphate reductase [Bacteroides sp.]